MTEVHEVLGNFPVILPIDDVADEAALEEALPCRPRHSGQDEANSEQVGQPEVVGGHWRILLCGHIGLVHEAASCLAPECLPDVGGAMDPAEGPGILREGLVRVTKDGMLLDVQVVLLADHKETQHDHECRALEDMINDNVMLNIKEYRLTS